MRKLYQRHERVNVSSHVMPFRLYVNNAEHMALMFSCHVKVSGELICIFWIMQNII